MNRSLKLSMLVALALGSSQVLALDLGQVRSNLIGGRLDRAEFGVELLAREP